MSMQTLYVYNQFLNLISNEEINFNNDEFKVMLVSSAYTPNINSHKYKSDIIGESTGVGYNAGGLVLNNVKYTVDGNIATFSANNPKWEELDIDNVRYIVLYDNTPSEDTSKPLLCYIDLGDTLNILNAELEVIWNINGIIRFTIR